MEEPFEYTCPICCAPPSSLEKVFSYTAPPQGEIGFSFTSKSNYLRHVLRCRLCGHFISVHNMKTNGLYESDYVDSTYKGTDGIRQAFERILSLPPSRSDNVGRVNAIERFSDRFSADSTPDAGRPKAFRSVLDVGSGLCVFLHRMKSAGWDCTAVDPDERSVLHARKAVGVRAVCGNFMDVAGLGEFDLVTFNKVLEHVEDPAKMLSKAKENVKPGGFVYVEVPDGEAAAEAGPEREEFFIDHLHVFSAASLALLAVQAGFRLLLLERLREPSSKFTLRAFMSPVG